MSARIRALPKSVSLLFRIVIRSITFSPTEIAILPSRFCGSSKGRTAESNEVTISPAASNAVTANVIISPSLPVPMKLPKELTGSSKIKVSGSSWFRILSNALLPDSTPSRFCTLSWSPTSLTVAASMFSRVSP